MRKGIIQTVLNVVIMMVMVGIIFAASFFVFELVLRSISGQEVVKGFEDFIKPLSAACNGDSAFSTGVSLPLHTPYNYAIVQTRVRRGDKLLSPVMKNSCTDSYCLCLLRFPKKNYNTWLIKPESQSFLGQDVSNLHVTVEGADDTRVINEPAPLWHFNTPGVALFPAWMKRAIKHYVFQLVTTLVQEIASYLVANVACCTAATYACFLCIAGITTIYYTLSECIIEFVLTYQREITEPVIVVNYPSNFMTTSQPEHLYWTNSDRVFDCSTVSRWGDEEEQEDARDALGVAMAAAYQGFWKGLRKGISRGANVFSGAKRFAFKAAALAAGAAGAFATTYDKLVHGRIVYGIARVPVTIPDNTKPECYVLDLLSARGNIDLSRWASMGKQYVSLGLNNSYDESVYNTSSIDVLNCVSIDDLGPLCDSNTKVLLDYSDDFIYYYRLLDPVNDPLKSLYCEYSQQSKGYNINLLESVVEGILGEGLGLPEAMVDGLTMIIGEIFLGGLTSLSGLMVECASPGVVPIEKPQYFQYWVPYFDSQGITGYDGQIPILEAELVDRTSSGENNCVNGVERRWGECYDDVKECVEIFKQCHEDCDLEKEDGSIDYEACCGDLSDDAGDYDYNFCCVDHDYCSFAECEYVVREEEVDCFNYCYFDDICTMPYNDYDPGCEEEDIWDCDLLGKCVEGVFQGFTRMFSPELEVADEYAKMHCDPCRTEHFLDCQECKSGLHLKPQGVMI